MKESRLAPVLWVGLSLLVVISGCELMSRDFYRDAELVPDEGKGMLVLVLDGGQIPTAKTLVPGLSMDIASYDISGTYLTTPDPDPPSSFGPINVLVGELAAGSVYTRTDLTPGDWTMTAVAKNTNGDQIGSGTTETFPVRLNQIASVDLDVLPDTGPGSLLLTLKWLDASIPGAEVRATLEHATTGLPGSIGNLATGGFVIDTASSPDQATYTRDHAATPTPTGIDAGYYSLWLELFANAGTDSEAKVMGDTVSVRIVTGQQTQGLWDLTSGDGGASVTIISDLKNPIGVTLTAVDNGSGSWTVTATLDPNTCDSFEFSWYLDGNSSAVRGPITVAPAPPDPTSDAYTFNHGALSNGPHNLSVLVTATDGGAIHSVNSATYPFVVSN